MVDKVVYSYGKEALAVSKLALIPMVRTESNSCIRG